MALLVFLAGVAGMYGIFVLMVELEKAHEKEEPDWDNESWETQRG